MLRRLAATIDDPLDDLAVLVLFSVFEAIVRDAIAGQVRPQLQALQHPTLRKAGADALQMIEEGSFFRILEPFKTPALSSLIEQVNQVRRYRNWVAHGRQPDNRPLEDVDPKSAYERLRELLKALGLRTAPASTE